MKRRAINPWEWQNRAGFSQAWRVEGAGTLLFISGQAPISADGELVGGDDFETQCRQVFQNLSTVVDEAGATLESVVKLTVFLTDIRSLPEYTRIKGEFFRGEQPASTAVEVAALARRDAGRGRGAGRDLTSAPPTVRRANSRSPRRPRHRRT